MTLPRRHIHSCRPCVVVCYGFAGDSREGSGRESSKSN